MTRWTARDERLYSTLYWRRRVHTAEETIAELLDHYRCLPGSTEAKWLADERETLAEAEQALAAAEAQRQIFGEV